MSEKFVSPVAPPEGLERELLTIMAEECVETAKRITKALRFGSTEIQPGQPYTNTERISLEFGDIIATSIWLEKRGWLPRHMVRLGMHNKDIQLAKYLQSKFDDCECASSTIEPEGTCHKFDSKALVSALLRMFDYLELSIANGEITHVDDQGKEHDPLDIYSELVSAMDLINGEDHRQVSAVLSTHLNAWLRHD